MTAPDPEPNPLDRLADERAVHALVVTVPNSVIGQHVAAAVHAALVQAAHNEAAAAAVWRDPEGPMHAADSLRDDEASYRTAAATILAGLAEQLAEGLDALHPLTPTLPDQSRGVWMLHPSARPYTVNHRGETVRWYLDAAADERERARRREENDGG